MPLRASALSSAHTTALHLCHSPYSRTASPLHQLGHYAAKDNLSLMGSIHSEVSHAALKLHLDYHNLQNLKMILRKLKRRNQSFHRDPLTPVNLYRAPGSPSWQGQQYAPWIFLMETITCIQHDKRLKVKNFYPASKMSSKMSGSTVIKKENLT